MRTLRSFGNFKLDNNWATSGQMQRLRDHRRRADRLRMLISLAIVVSIFVATSMAVPSS